MLLLAALYVSLVEHPSGMSLGAEFAVREFAPSYRRATIMQAPLALAGFLLAAIAWMEGAHIVCLWGGATLGLAVPFTLVIMMPVNRRLHEPDLTRNPARAAALLSQWSRLHAARVGLSLVALLAFLTLLGLPVRP